MITENIVINHNYSWIDIEHPVRLDVDFLKEEFHLPPLLVQDCLRPEHLPKYEKMPSGHFILTRAFDLNVSRAVSTQEMTNKLAIFIADDRLITIHNEDLTFLRKFIDQLNIEGAPDTLQGLVHSLIKTITQTYEAPMHDLQQQYENFENDILNKTDSLSNKRVYEFRRQLFIIKGVLKLTQNSIIHCRVFWENDLSLQQDLKENLDQLYFRLDDLSHNFDQLFGLYISINDQRNNEVMKILTVFSTTILPLTFIASFYGMNFEYIPGLHSVSGFVSILLVMATLTFSTIWYFNKKKWFNPAKN